METKPTIRDLLKLFYTIECRIADNSGEITPELDEELKSITQNLSSKIDQVSYIQERSKVSAEYYKQKSDEYYRLSKSMERVDEKLTEYIKFGMQQNNLERIEGEEVIFKLSKRGQSVEITNAALLPDEACTIVRQPSKTRIKEMILSGQAPAGADLRDTVVLTKSIKRKELK